MAIRIRSKRAPGARSTDVVSVIDTTTGKRIADIPVGELPWAVAVR